MARAHTRPRELCLHHNQVPVWAHIIGSIVEEQLVVSPETASRIGQFALERPYPERHEAHGGSAARVVVRRDLDLFPCVDRVPSVYTQV